MIDFEAECLKIDPLLWADDDGESCVCIRRKKDISCTCSHGVKIIHPFMMTSVSPAIASGNNASQAWEAAYFAIAKKPDPEVKISQETQDALLHACKLVCYDCGVDYPLRKKHPGNPDYPSHWWHIRYDGTYKHCTADRIRSNLLKQED